MKVLIADDHKVVRLGLSMIVKEEFPYAEIAQAGNATEVYAQIRQHTFDLMLMDLRMPETDSLQMLEQILLIEPALKILIISLNPEKIFAIRYLKAGASGYLQKSEDDSLIKTAIRKVMNGNKYMSETVSDLMTHYLINGSTGNPFDLLAKKEFEVAMHLINGLSTDEICNTMHLQRPTISTHKNRIFEKLSIKNMHDLLRLAKENNVGQEG